MHSEGDPHCQCMDCTMTAPRIDDDAEEAGEGLFDVMMVER